MDKGQASWKEQQDTITRLRSRLEEYGQQISDRQKELDSYKHHVETLTRRCETLQREQGAAGHTYKEVAQLQDLLDKEKSDFAEAQKQSDWYREEWRKEFDAKTRLELQLRAVRAENEKLLG